MTHHTRHQITATTDASLGDVLAWAEANNESYDAIRELHKIPARMDMIDDDIGLIPAGLVHFDKVIAPTPFGIVSKSKNIETAKRRSNSRVRALLVRFHDAMGSVAPHTGREDWDRLIALVQNKKVSRRSGALFPTGKHKSLFSLRARCRTTPSGLIQAEIDRVVGDATPKVRKSIRKGLTLINDLIALQNVLPEFALSCHRLASGCRTLRIGRGGYCGRRFPTRCARTLTACSTRHLPNRKTAPRLSSHAWMPGKTPSASLPRSTDP